MNRGWELSRMGRKGIEGIGSSGATRRRRRPKVLETVDVRGLQTSVVLSSSLQAPKGGQDENCVGRKSRHTTGESYI